MIVKCVWEREREKNKTLLWIANYEKKRKYSKKVRCARMSYLQPGCTVIVCFWKSWQQASSNKTIQNNSRGWCVFLDTSYVTPWDLWAALLQGGVVPLLTTPPHLLMTWCQLHPQLHPTQKASTHFSSLHWQSWSRLP